MLTINQQFGFPLPIHDATLFHAADIDPKLHWSVGNLAGRDLDEGLDAELETMADNLRTDVVEGRAPAKLQHFLDQSRETFMALVQKDPDLEQIIPGKRFEFVVGAPRTGGTFFVSELFKCANLDHRNFNKLMIHDGIPDTDALVQAATPLSNLSALFQLAQFLVWAREAFADSPVVIKKKIYFSFWMNQLGRVFGDRATYYVTIRHPVPTIISFFETLARADHVSPNTIENAYLDHYFLTVNAYNRITKQDWDLLNAFEKMLCLWESYYVAIADACATKNNIVPLAMGDQMHDTLASLNPGFQIPDHTPKSRDYGEYLYFFKTTLDDLEERIDRIQAVWRTHGLDFPDLTLL